MDLLFSRKVVVEGFPGSVAIEATKDGEILISVLWEDAKRYQYSKSTVESKIKAAVMNAVANCPTVASSVEAITEGVSTVMASHKQLSAVREPWLH